MKLKYLGTAAAEGIPAMFCNCDACRRALKKGGRNFMTRSQAIIDDGLLIDFNHDTYFHFLNMNRTLWDIENVLITHSHFDHFTTESNFCRFNNIAYNLKTEKLKVYLNEFSYDIMKRMTEVVNEDVERRNKRYEYIFIKEFEPVKVGDYLVTPLPAEHMKKGQSLIFLIEKDGKTIFYGNDTGFFGEEIDDYLAKNNKKIDLLSLDCTHGDSHGDDRHMSMEQGAKIYERFLKRGLLIDGVKKVYTHFSHNGGKIYDELVESAKKYGFEVAYDGFEVEI